MEIIITVGVHESRCDALDIEFSALRNPTVVCPSRNAWKVASFHAALLVNRSRKHHHRQCVCGKNIHQTPQLIDTKPRPKHARLHPVATQEKDRRMPSPRAKVLCHPSRRRQCRQEDSSWFEVSAFLRRMFMQDLTLRAQDRQHFPRTFSRICATMESSSFSKSCLSRIEANESSPKSMIETFSSLCARLSFLRTRSLVCSLIACLTASSCFSSAFCSTACCCTPSCGQISACCCCCRC